MHRAGWRLPRLLATASIVLGISQYQVAAARACAVPVTGAVAHASYATIRLTAAQVGGEVGAELASWIPVAPALVAVKAPADEIAGTVAEPASGSVDNGRNGTIAALHAEVARPSIGMSLYRSSAWAHQATNSWCVGASIQMMVNLVTGGSDLSVARQNSYEYYAYHHSRYVAWLGAEVDGWANALNYYGAGTYSVGAYRSFDAAVKAAVARMRLTGKPVGLVAMWGRHAWVMAGFTTSGDDPASSQNFTVTSVTIMAPFAGSIAYDPPPGSVVSMSYLATKLMPYWDDFPTIWDGRYVIVEP